MGQKPQTFCDVVLSEFNQIGTTPRKASILMPSFDNYPAVKEYLYSLKHHGAKYGIDRMVLLAEKLGHPERLFPIIHVAGTNGKGSTCAMLESIYRLGGYKTGMFTSPHLVHQGERVQVNRKILSHDEIMAYTNELKIIAEALGKIDPDDHPSFFEFMTGMAFLHFARQQVDIGIIEVGLGGRLDATNIVTPDVSVITTISRDHCEQLGHSIEGIAREKAGIIKPGVPVVLGHICPEAEKVIREIAAERGCKVFTIAEEYGTNESFYPESALKGRYQRWNAATAALVVTTLRNKFPIAPEYVLAGLDRVSWAGRWDIRQVGDRTVILDTSHNPEGAELLADNLKELVTTTGQKPIIVAGALGLSRAEFLFPILAEYAAEIIMVRPQQSRACSFEELRQAIPPTYEGDISMAEIRDIFPSAGTCTLGKKGDTIVVTGSIYLVGEAMEALLFEERVAEHVLQDIP